MTSIDPEVDALVADRYLDGLLGAGGGNSDHVSSEAGPDPELRDAARVLRSTLVRVHPSFRFEDRLAGRLADLAAAQRAPALAAAGGGRLLRFPAGGRSGAMAADADPVLDAILRGDLDPTDDDAVERVSRVERVGSARRPLIVGGALTSAAISLVGVAYVAWRASRPEPRSRRAMARGARAARPRRTADGLAGLAGLGGPA